MDGWGEGEEGGWCEVVGVFEEGFRGGISLWGGGGV